MVWQISDLNRDWIFLTTLQIVEKNGSSGFISYDKTIDLKE
jgi:hypothetical protein